jgi:hypothetical protein
MQHSSIKIIFEFGYLNFFKVPLPRLKRGAPNNELRLYPMNLEQVMLFKEKDKHK